MHKRFAIPLQMVATVVLMGALLWAAHAQTPPPPSESDQIRQVAQSGLELLKRTPVTGTTEAQALVNVHFLLDAISRGVVNVSRPEPPSKLQGGPTPDPSTQK